MNVPAGLSGWVCQRCGKACPSIPDDLDAAQAKCPHCRHWTAVWIPHEPDNSELGTRNSELPRAERAKAWIAHMHAVCEDPTLPADLSEWEHQQTIR